MQINSFGTRTAMSITTAVSEVDYTCNAQGMWLYVPGDQTQSVVFSLASSTATTDLIGELAPGESDIFFVAQTSNIPLYAFTRSGTSVLTAGGVQ